MSDTSTFAQPASVRIPPPDPNKEPLKNNVFRLARTANTQLCPLFPYVGDGDMVPAVTVLTGGQDGGSFIHFNTVDEVVVLYGTNGAMGHAGDVFIGGREHVVTDRVFAENTDPNALMSLVVTQRQSEHGVPQNESLTFLCEKCQNPLLVTRFEAKGAKPSDARPGFENAFETIGQSSNFANTFNASESARTCEKCRHVNAAFPLPRWGWDNYREAVDKAERSRDYYFSALAEIGEAK